MDKYVSAAIDMVWHYLDILDKNQPASAHCPCIAAMEDIPELLHKHWLFTEHRGVLTIHILRAEPEGVYSQLQ